MSSRGNQTHPNSRPRVSEYPNWALVFWGLGSMAMKVERREVEGSGLQSSLLCRCRGHGRCPKKRMPSSYCICYLCAWVLSKLPVLMVVSTSEINTLRLPHASRDAVRISLWTPSFLGWLGSSGAFRISVIVCRANVTV